MSAAPKVAARVGSNGTGSATFTVNVPVSSYSDGDTILVHLCSADVTHTPPSGSWVQVKSYQDSGFSRVSTFALRSDGSPGGGTVNFTGGSAAPFSAVTQHVTGAEFGLIVASLGSDGADDTPTPDVVVADWDDGNNLFVAVAGFVDDDAGVTDFPDLYLHTAEDYQSGGGTNAGAGIAVATRRLRADEDQPGPFTLDESEAWVAYSLVLRPSYEEISVPSGPDGLAVHMRFEGDWVDVGQGAVYSRDPVTIRHGRPDWAGQPDPASCRLTLDNREGQWSPDYDGGLYAGRHRRNVPIRIGVQGDTGIESATGVDGDWARLPHASADILAGDFDLRVEFQLHGGPAEGTWESLVWKVDGSNNGWALHLGRTNGRPDIRLIYYEPSTTQRVAVCSSGDGDQPPDWLFWRRAAIQITLDESTGDVAFGWATSIDGPFQPAGVHNPAGGASSIDFPTVVTILGRDFFGARYWSGRIHKAQLRDGIDGSLVFDLDLTGETPGSSSVEDDTARTWSIEDDARLDATEWRFHGEVASLPVQWALKGDQFSRIEANGILRRLRQWDELLQSPLRRGLERGALSANIVGYWPMEEKGDATLNRLSNVVGVEQFALKTGEPDPAANTDFLASDAILKLGDSRWHAKMDPIPASTGEWMIRFLLSVPASIPGDVALMHIVTGDLEYRFNVLSSGNLQITSYREGALVHTGSSFAFGITGQPMRVQLGVDANGSGVDVGIFGQAPLGTIGGGTDTFATAVPSVPTFIRINEGGDAGDIAIGHLTVETLERFDGFDEELDAFIGEPAGDRIERLCAEEGIPVALYGAPAATVRLGPQGIQSFLDLLIEAADTDLGILFDRPDGLGLGYRTGRSMGAQDPAYTIDYDSAADALGTPPLLRDDNEFSNDVTVTNWSKATARAELTTGEQSTAEPPAGAGRYPKRYPVNVYSADALQGHASARLRLHSVDTPRITGLVLPADQPTPIVTAAERTQILGLVPGDKIALTDLPPTAHPDDLDQILQGWSEVIGSHTHRLEANTTPAEPWEPGVVEQADDIRYDTAGSILATGEDAGATTLYVATTTGPIWTTDGADLPFDILVGSARVTVTAISGSASPQTFTVAATPRALAGGDPVRLADAAYYSL